jgi:hypothetical protein
MKLCMLIDLERINNLIKPVFLKTKKYECGGQLKVKIHIFFHRDNSGTTALRQMKFGTVKHHEHAYRFNSNHYFV